MRSYLYSLITDEANGLFVKALRFFLLILSFVYSFFVRLQALAYEHKFLKPDSAAAVVISVGNITWGGTGKTSMVMLLIDFLLSKGKRIAVLSRGYKKNQKYLPRRPGFANELRRGEQAGKIKNKKLEAYKLMGDEPFLLQGKYPQVNVLVGRSRIINAIKAVKELKCDTIILDDAFQHRRMGRDLDIVLIDVLNPFGNGYLLPRGILREPARSIARADIIVLTNCEFFREKQKKVWFDINWINDKALIVYASYRFKRLYDMQTKEIIERADIAKRAVCILASIGNFLSFKLSVNDFLKADVKQEFNFPDHYEYREEDLVNILDTCRRKNIDTIITTEKDAVRLGPLLTQDCGIRMIILEVKLEITENKEKFFKAILDAYDN